MKRIPWILPVLSLVFIACAGGPKSTALQKGPMAQTAPYEAFVLNTETVLLPDLGKKSPRMELSLILLDPAGDELLQGFLYDGAKPEDYVNDLIQTYTDFYREILAMRDEGEEPPAALLAWSHKESHRVHTYSRLQVIARTKEYYSGGAHGMREKNYWVIDLVEKKQIQLGDLFLEGTEAVLQTHIEDALRVYSDLEPGVPLSRGYYFNDSVEVGDFFLTPQGIGFHWNPYEIAPYSVGPVKITLPYEEIGDLLSPRGKFLISQFN